jgi:ribonuclease HIII
MNLKIIENKGNEHTEYMFRLEEHDKSLTVTQFISGKLLIQGGYSSLVKKIVEKIESIKPLTETERMLFFVPEENKGVFEKTFRKDGITSLNLDMQARSEIGEAYDFLYENDKKTYKTGIGLIEIIKKCNEILPEFNFLIAPFAIVFEGFLIKILINKNFFTEDSYRKNEGVADIGNCLRLHKFKKYMKNPDRDQHILADLEIVWKSIRCKELHSDALEEEMIVSADSLQKAIDRVGRIRDCINKAYNYLIKYGYTDDEVKKNENLLNEIHIGTDESGKGDYFGPLATAGVLVDKTTSERLAASGVKDSKELSDSQILDLAKKIRIIVGETNFSVVSINPEKYNQLYKDMGNLNMILAWSHSRSLENILSNHDCKYAIADQFGDEKYIKNALLEKGKNINLIQRPKAETDIAVAAASILARETFLIRLEAFSKDYGIDLPKGASDKVIQQAKKFVSENGSEKLNLVAKLHFKTTKSVLE